ncbi:MAG: MotA/TolQ/ExbB proton channel family protein [Proteiniphilum sp.]|jgi:biopolymer transport protein ExbB|nr:MotA/TolQ/ExbB proton channel family protein [Proteiniphilum sp.]NCB24576.1 MotA/TolQ/ExbB proton channel family protein [Bacteroidia bacterium]MDD2938016.1 MotA/TolQ/ExbB proton channel family protein [Proteiniphilum sp.]MDD3075815.1 MotA/TolQ/ExbB proton channel family protein [Proteiniphilum sp.]MDD3780228.1 MotA/TolQ/ExbB proton channel family protein [Proteiniphilum sp.]
MNLLQILPADTAQAIYNTMQEATAETESVTMNAFDLALKGGWLMIVLLILLLMTIYVLIERTLVINKAAKEDSSFMNRIKDYIHDGKIDAAQALCRNTDTPSARMVEKGISRLGRPTADVMSAIENQGNIEISKLEKGLPVLATSASGAPMVGFLGTVTGMVKAFMDMASAGANVDVNILSTGIYEALVTTVGGLIVGIIALFAYNYLATRIKGIVNKLEMRIMEFMDILNEPAV